MDPRLIPLWNKIRYSSLVREQWPHVLERLGAYARLMRLHRPIGTFLLLWPTLWALWLACAGHPSPKLFTVFVIGAFVMRAAGCIINDFADRNFDPHVTRTRERPLATGEVSVKEALALFLLLGLVALDLVLMLNTLCLELAVVCLVLAVSYPFMKRYTYLPQPYLGLAFGWGIPMAYAAATGAVPTEAWLIFIANILWATVYDTMYAMVDRPDDLKIGVKSTAIHRRTAGLVDVESGAGGHPPAAGRRLLHRSPVRRGLRRLRAVPHTQTRTGEMLPGIPEQQLVWSGGVCWDSPEFHF